MTMTQTFEPPAHAGAQAEGSELLAGTAVPQTPQTKSQSYASLVWRRFRHSIGGLVGGFLVTLILLIAVFANFLSPYDPGERSRTSIYLPPQGLHFFAADGFHLVPFTHPIEIELDPATYQPKPTEIPPYGARRHSWVRAGAIHFWASLSNGIFSPRRPTVLSTSWAPTAKAGTCYRVCSLEAA